VSNYQKTAQERLQIEVFVTLTFRVFAAHQDDLLFFDSGGVGAHLKNLAQTGHSSFAQ
jgi:hypothetical protein